MFKILAATLWVFVVEVVGRRIPCDIHVEYLCPNNYFQSLRQLQTPFPEVDALEEHCGEAIPYFSCWADMAEECSLEEEYYSIPVLRQVVMDICNGSSKIGMGYREHIKCINTWKEEFQTTLTKLRDFFQEFAVYLNESIDTQGHPGYICLMMSHLPKAYTEVVELKCGSHSAMFFWQLLSPVNIRCSSKPDFLRYRSRLAEYIARLKKNDAPFVPCMPDPEVQA